MEPRLTAGCTAGSSPAPLTHHMTCARPFSLPPCAVLALPGCRWLGYLALSSHCPPFKAAQPFYNPPQSSHFHRSQAMSNTI